MQHKRYIHFIMGLSLFLGLIIWNSLKGELAISEKALYETVSDLSSEEMDGRMAGTDGYDKAANYVANRMLDIGLQPFVRGDYYQEVITESNTFYGRPMVRIAYGENMQELILGKDYLFRGLSGSGMIDQADMVFCGYGISAPELGYDDYAGIEVENKVVLMVKENPKWEKEGLNLSVFSTRYKAQTAMQKGALAVVYVNSVHQEYIPKPIGSVLDGEGVYTENIPQLHIERALVDTLLKIKGLDLTFCQAKIDSLMQPCSFAMPVLADIHVKTNYVSDALSSNVLGMIEGSDPLLKNEYVVVAAHLDHVGRQADDFFFPGANDNASGVAALLEIAHLMQEGEVSPARSVIFAAFTGEESGLRGAEHFVQHWPLKEKKMVAMLNMDCIAHGDSVIVYGGDRASSLWQKVCLLDENMNKLVVAHTASSDGCDAEPFNRIEVPTLSFVSKYSYTHIHQHTDSISTLNFDLLAYITQLVYQICLEQCSPEEVV